MDKKREIQSGKQNFITVSYPLFFLSQEIKDKDRLNLDRISHWCDATSWLNYSSTKLQGPYFQIDGLRIGKQLALKWLCIHSMDISYIQNTDK
jgi:hypothetical protein